ncbi:MAG: hypothetical protein QM489_04000 [Candidatus Izemoplasma sp.]
MHTNFSHRTVDAVLQGDRTNDNIEQYSFIVAKQNLARLSNVIADVEAKNIIKVIFPEFRKYKESAAWSNDNAYKRYIDVYLQLSHNNVKEPDELWGLIWKDYKDIIHYTYYCIDLFVRLLGITDEIAVRFYNKKIQEI